MNKPATIDELWDCAEHNNDFFEPRQLSGLPLPVQRYLQHAITHGAKLASAVRLRMHGQIKLRNWLPFTAEEVICWNRGMIWTATVHMDGLPVKGFDRIVDGEGEMRWRLFGVVPMTTASGTDITRSAEGRMIAESATPIGMHEGGARAVPFRPC